MVSGRSTEQRGNGLKFVRQIINENIKQALIAQSGSSELFFEGNSSFIKFGEFLMSRPADREAAQIMCASFASGNES